jgi:site-specific DNA recombinase
MKPAQDMKIRAALYARVSSEEQVEGYSIDAQRRAFQTLCQSKGWIPYHEYIEEGKSARTENINKRPVFKEAIADALNKNFDILVVHKVDRFSRKLRVTLEYFDKLGKGDVGFVSIMEQMDFSTPWGKFALSMLGALAELYSDNLSQETKKGWHERRKQGLYCGTLPFGAMKDEHGIPIPDTQDRKTNIDGQEIVVHNYEGLKQAFGLAAQGKSDREVAISINAGGYRSTGTHGPRPFSRDTIKDILTNRFYIGEITDGNGGWIKAVHKPFIDLQLFEVVQEGRPLKRSPRKTINIAARTYSLSYITRCARCGSSIRMQTNSKGRARVYCSSRSEVHGCDFSGTFLDIYESQIEWYLTNFTIPDDYQKKILEVHRRLVEAYGKSQDVESQREVLETVLARLKEQYRWGHISQQEYLREYQQTETQLRQLTPARDEKDKLKGLAHFLSNVADAWRAANQEQRNKLARTLFEEIRIDSGGKVVAVKPKSEFQPFFKLSYERHAKDIGSDPSGIRTRDLHRDRVACLTATPWGL